MKIFSILLLSTFILACYSQVVKVTDTNFDQVVKKSDEWVLEFYADWCGYCQHFNPKYKEAEKKAKSTIYNTIFFGQVNIDENPALAARFFVSRLPSMYHIKDHQVRSLSPLPRTSDQLVSFLENKEWETVQPIGYWRSPFGIL
ncbi:thioredoxin-like protein [Cunninghamella echinulata]|nr:thioredoxin-like protein [Cunninghamella echinulata]